MKKEMETLTKAPPCNICCWSHGDSLESLEANITGSTGSPYEAGVFKLTIQIPVRYPFEPPQVSFVTPIYHPNIDSVGRICLDVLKMPPKGAWKPSMNITTVLLSVQLLMNEPNPDDPLCVDIADEFRYKKEQFTATAKAWCEKHAKQNVQKVHKGGDASDQNQIQTHINNVVKRNKDNSLCNSTKGDELKLKTVGNTDDASTRKEKYASKPSATTTLPLSPITNKTVKRKVEVDVPDSCSSDLTSSVSTPQTQPSSEPTSPKIKMKKKKHKRPKHKLSDESEPKEVKHVKITEEVDDIFL